MRSLKPVLLCLAAVAAFAVGNVALVLSAPTSAPVEIVASR